MGRTGLESAHPDVEGHACHGRLAAEAKTGLFRCPECGALAETADGTIIGHGSEEA